MKPTTKRFLTLSAVPMALGMILKAAPILAASVPVNLERDSGYLNELETLKVKKEGKIDFTKSVKNLIAKEEQYQAQERRELKSVARLEDDARLRGAMNRINGAANDRAEKVSMSKPRSRVKFQSDN